ncbi:PspC domain-containing protein [Kitasatospora sp. RB6PN24]|uniref:PspC domain-containing protein n=1 Tax=Kitasatospora humi TaxID=2893891 RepID=UPI001E4DCCC2|nr:PspC domain-containing protein [Kitasatospora humi]MCC9310548.1 PspC domain-containing protein [Kitasatospora humi]
MTEEQSTAPTDPGGHDEPGAQRPPLARSEDHRVVGGVCAGLGRHLDIDPVVFRVVTAVLCLTGGLGLFLYGLAWLIVPSEEGDAKHGRTELQRLLTGRVDGQSIGAVLMTVIGTGVFFSWIGSGDSVMPLLLLGAMVFFAVRYDPERRRRARGAGAPPRPAGPYDRAAAEPGGGQPGGADGSPPADRQRRRLDLHTRWTTPESGFQPRVGLAEEAVAATTTVTDAPPADTPPTGRTGYLWDPRHPDRDPWGAAATPPPGMPAQAWWQRTDLPQGDPLRKSVPPVPPAPARPRREGERSVLGLCGLLIAVGAAWAVWSTGGRSPVLLSTVLATGLLVLGLTLLVGSRWGRARRLAVPALLTTLALAGLGRTPAVTGDAIGHRSYAPVNAQDVRRSYLLGAGDLHLDLSSLDPRGTTVTSTIRLGAGNAVVVLPPDLAADLTLRTVAGQLQLPDGSPSDSDGIGAHRTVHFDAADGAAAKGTVDLTVEVGLGDVQVVR